MSKTLAKGNSLSSYKFDTSSYIIVKSGVSRSSETGKLVSSSPKSSAGASLSKQKK